jgi:hypothetical protein
LKKILALLVAMVMALLLYAVPVSAAGPNLIVNGDFEAGNTGFTTQYTYLDPSNTGPWTLGPPYMYTVGTNPHLYQSAWTSFGDHTTGTGKMMIVNGTTSEPPKLVWGQDVTLTCVPTYPVSTYPLFAGQSWEIGEVLVKASADGICVKFVLTDEAAITDGWVITEVHVAVAATAEGIPQKNGNPIPGQFPVNVDIDPGVTETEWYCLDYDWTASTQLVIAAHAVVSKIQAGYTVSDCLVSGAASDNVLLLAEDPLNPGYPVGYTAPYQTYSGTPTPSVLAWTHSAWAPYGITGANWISSAEYAETPDFNTWRLFTRTFNLPPAATNISGTMWVNCDNAEDVYLNGQFVGNGAPAVVYGSSPPSGPAHGWSSVEGPWDVSSKLIAGSNALWTMTRNYGWPGGVTANPTALIYKLCYQYDMPPVVLATETAWGGTCGNFTGKNWATYICYTPQEECDYGSYILEFWAGNSYSGTTSYSAAPAILQVKINGEVVGSSLALEYNPPYAPTPGWMKYSATWNAGSATHALIEISDLRIEYWGDDFVIDDISFVRQ